MVGTGLGPGMPGLRVRACGLFRVSVVIAQFRLACRHPLQCANDKTGKHRERARTSGAGLTLHTL